MHDMTSKMAELKFEAPLAQFEEADDWMDFQTSANLKAAALSDTLNIDNLKMLKRQQQCDLLMMKKDAVSDFSSDLNCNDEDSLLTVDEDNNDNDFKNRQQQQQQLQQQQQQNGQKDSSDNFNETFSGSLEDLVNTFDDKITKCFGNYEESVENLAPVQVRTQEEIMNECQMWWTITGNFGNILPIDWSRSSARRLHLPALRLAGAALGGGQDSLCNTPLDPLGSEDEAVAADLDMHKLILGGLPCDDEPPMKTAEEVLREIDDLMDEGCSSADEGYYTGGSGGGSGGGYGGSQINEALASAAERAREVLGSPLYKDKLRTMSLSQLNELYMELESLIRDFSETLIAELALRDELDYDKELKNAFISLLLAVQNRRRQHHVERKRSNMSAGAPRPLQSKYLTTVIPYHAEAGAPDNRALGVLIKILKAINEDSPTVPTLLTDYILKVLCPT